MTKLSLNHPLKNLDDSTIKDGTRDFLMNVAVASALSKTQAGPPVKCYDLAVRFYSGAAVELDDTDLKLVQDVVEKSDFIPLVKGPILKAIEDAKIAKLGQPDKSV